MASLTIRGLTELRSKLGDANASTLLYPIMTAAALEAQGKLTKYPPSSEANMPFQRRWYERNWGTKWLTKEGATHGKKTSQMLGKSWTTTVNPASAWRATVGTIVTYGPAVQDRDHQASFHKRRGWVTVQDVAEQYGPEIVRKIEAAIARLFKGGAS